MEKRKTLIAGKETTIIKCPLCEVWIPETNYSKHKGSIKCKESQKHKAVRNKAVKSVLKAFQTLI